MNGEIERNLFLINDKIKRACQIYGKEQSKINLIAVSKTVEAFKIKQAIALGCKDFGENYVQEAEKKWQELKIEFPQIKLHLIGHLQSNKAAQAVALFDVIQSLDSKKLAIALAKEITKQQKNLEIFVQVNIGEELQKSGIAPSELNEFIQFCQQELKLNIAGLMCVPPSNESASTYFALLAKMAKENNLPNLSMGMSADFEEAIAMNANYIRIGTAIFGSRN